MNAYADLVNYIRHAGTRLRQFPGIGVTLLTVTRVANDTLCIGFFIVTFIDL